MPDMFFPEDEDLNLQAPMLQQGPPNQGLMNNFNPEMLKQILAELMAPLSAQVPNKQMAPQGDSSQQQGLMDKYGPQLKALQGQNGMNQMSPEEKDDMNAQLLVSSYFADDNRRLSGQPSEMMAIQKQIANQRMNAGNEGLERNNKLIEQLKNLQGLDNSTVDSQYKRQLMGEEINKKKREAGLSNPESDSSKAAVQAFKEDVSRMANRALGSKHNAIRSLAPDLAAFVQQADGKSAVEIENFIKRIDKSKAEADKEVGYDTSSELGNARLGIQQSQLELTRNRLEAMKDIAAGKAELANKKAEIHLTKPQEKLNKEINDLNISLQRMDELAEGKKFTDTGPIQGNIISPLKNVFNIDNSDMNRLKAEVAQLFNPITKQFAGVAVSAGEWKRLEPMIPSDTDNDKTFLDKLNVAKKEAQRMLAEKTNEYQKVGGQPIDRSEVANRANSISQDIKMGASAGQAIPKQFQSPLLSEQDRKAIEWANKNSKDPRAAEIKRRLGAQ